MNLSIHGVEKIYTHKAEHLERSNAYVKSFYIVDRDGATFEITLFSDTSESLVIENFKTRDEATDKSNSKGCEIKGKKVKS